MTAAQHPLDLDRVANHSVDRYVSILFLVALLFFLVNILLGFLNALTTGPIPRWQFLTHLHAAALGWITLSAIAVTFWIFTARQELSESAVRKVRALTYLAIVAITCYVASFPLAFHQQGTMLNLLPIFGSGALLILIAITVYAFTQLPHQPTVTTVHVFVSAALVVASLGATMGVVIGLNRATGAGISDVGIHAPVMLFYLLLLASAIVDWFVAGRGEDRWSLAGIAQALALVIAGIVPPIGIGLQLEMVMPLMLLGLVAFFLLFLGRSGWKALYTDPTVPGVRAWTFFGTLWLIPTVLVFPAEIAIEPPDWFFPVVAHTAFVGMTSNFLFGVLSQRTRQARRLHAWAEPSAMWLLNLGVAAFIALKIAMGTRHGAFVMGLGALLAVGVMLYRLVE